MCADIGLILHHVSKKKSPNAWNTSRIKSPLNDLSTKLYRTAALPGQATGYEDDRKRLLYAISS